LKPFLEKTIDILTECHALVDKMIGDEVMFVFPEWIGCAPSVLLLGQLLGGLHDLAYELQPEYKYRIGLSYGKVQLFHLVGEGYSEWSVVGEPVHVAKRLHAVDQLCSPDPVCGASGLSVSEFPIERARETLQHHLAYAAGFASRFSHEIIEDPRHFKGVGDVVWAYLMPKT